MESNFLFKKIKEMRMTIKKKKHFSILWKSIKSWTCLRNNDIIGMKICP